MPERPGGKPMPEGGSGANYATSGTGDGQHVKTKTTFTPKNGKGTISVPKGDGLKNVGLAGSIFTKNIPGAVVNLLSRIGGKKKDTGLKTEHKGLRQDPKTGTYYHKAPKHRPIIDRGGDGDGGTQMASQPAQAAQPIKPKIPPYKPYYMGFDFQKPINTATHRPLPMKSGGLSGGKRFGPPPKKGPNPHGKCPFRPDGIRGVGAVEKGRGVKFIGTK